jgi:hypothetical protein
MLFRFTWIFVALGLLGAVWLLVVMRRAADRPAPPVAPSYSGAARITQFYVNVGAIAKGETALLCYGVENAKSVTITPLEEKVAPALSRCLEVSPQHTTQYTIMAEGFDGKVASQSVTLLASPIPPPRILHFAGTNEGGRRVKLCYKVANAEQVRIDPGVAPPGKEPARCFVVEPARTTTYTLTAVGAQGRTESKQVIVEVDPS